MLKMQTWNSGRKDGAERPHTIRSGLDFTSHASLRVPLREAWGCSGLSPKPSQGGPEQEPSKALPSTPDPETGSLVIPREDS